MYYWPSIITEIEHHKIENLVRVITFWHIFISIFLIVFCAIYTILETRKKLKNFGKCVLERLLLEKIAADIPILKSIIKQFQKIKERGVKVTITLKITYTHVSANN